MKKRFQSNHRILLPGLAFRFAIAFLLCSPAIAQQLLAPNPNPGVIDVFDWQWVENYVPFSNSGTINNSGGTIYNYYGGIIDNTGTIQNYSMGLIWNDDTINNDGTIDNLGTIWNYATINNDGYIYNDGYFCNYYIIENWGTIDNLGTIYNDCGIENYGTIDNLGTISTQYNFFIHNRSSGTIHNSDTIENFGEIRNSYGGTIENDGTLHNSGGTFNNEGTIDNSGTIYNDYHIDNSGTIYNSGTINNRSMGNISGYLGTINNLSMGTIQNDGIIENFGGTFNNQGILKGTGTFIGNLLNDIGTVAPGNSAGTMTIDGDFTLDDFGILDIEIGGFTSGLFDVLDITGTAFLPGGNINFSFLDGYDIVADVGPGESWGLSFLKAGSIDSLFNPVINYNFMNLPYFQFNVFRVGNELVFGATNLVPLPSAVLLGGIGLAFSSWKLRRRREL